MLYLGRICHSAIVSGGLLCVLVIALESVLAHGHASRNFSASRPHFCPRPSPHNLARLQNVSGANRRVWIVTDHIRQIK